MNRTIRTVPALVAALLLGACGAGTTTGAPASSTAASSATATTTSSVDAAAEEQAVRKVFDDYKAAVRAKDGKAAVRTMSDNMLSTYLELKELALTSPEEQTSRIGTTWRFVVYTLRAEFDAAELRPMTSADVVAAAVDRGLVSEGALDRVVLDSVTVAGDSATAQVASADGKASGLAFEFAKEFGLWKFNPEPLLQLGDEAFKYAASQQGLTEDQFVDQMLATLYGADRVSELKRPLEG